MPLKMIRNERGEPVAEDVVRLNRGHAGAAVMGAFVTAAMGLFFLLLGNAVGLNVAHIGRVGGGAVRFWTWLYLACAGLFSYFAGPLVTGRFRDFDLKSSGSVHGIKSWGLATLIGGGIAMTFSPAARAVFAGVGNDAANWIAITIIGLGFFTAMAGGAAAKAMSSHLYEEEPGAIETPETTRKTVEQRSATG